MSRGQLHDGLLRPFKGLESHAEPVKELAGNVRGASDLAMTSIGTDKDKPAANFDFRRFFSKQTLFQSCASPPLTTSERLRVFPEALPLINDDNATDSLFPTNGRFPATNGGTKFPNGDAA